VRTSLFDERHPIPHTHLGQRADVVLVCPATARVIADYAAGASRDLLTATLLATRAPVVLCPAMHTEMWEHPAVQDNLALLASRGVHLVEPEVGRLAGGDVGAGRLADPTRVVDAVTARLAGTADLAGARVLVTAGGTREAIDPVRVITNRSSGKQGYAVAEAAARRGATVTLVTTVDRPVPHGVAEVVPVESAADLADAVLGRAASCDVVVMAAAVADFRPRVASGRKVKKADGVPEIVLEPTQDVLAELGRRRREGQVLVGFAAETDEVVASARKKLADKAVDLIVANDVTAPGAGFEHDTNAVVIVSAIGDDRVVPISSKQAVAEAIVDAVVAIRSH
jgi:phosphopantothenoylcysteine decarboxylase / phosphopantothenate---cysteine ligase